MGNMNRFLPGGDLNESDIPNGDYQLSHFIRPVPDDPNIAYVKGEATPSLKPKIPYLGRAALISAIESASL